VFRILLALCLLHPVLAYSYTQTIGSGPGIGIFYTRPLSVLFTFSSLSAPGGIGLLVVSAAGDINNNVETVQVYTGGVSLGSLFDDNFYFQDPIALTDSVAVPVSFLTNAGVGGSLTFNMVVPSNNPTAYVRFDSLSLIYPEPYPPGTAPPNPIPEPSTYMMLLAGLGLLGFMARRRTLHDAHNLAAVLQSR
jgi:hypothetical protein